MGVEEEFHVVDLATRELVGRAPELLERLPEQSYSAELQASVVETNSGVHTTLAGLRADLVALRARLAQVAEESGLGVVAAGTVPLVDAERSAITRTARFTRMLEDYQMLVREQLICGAQVHVQVDDRDLAVAVAQRVAPSLPVLLALTASSPYWMGADSGYASVRSLVWQRWPTAGSPGSLASAADHDRLVTDLVASGTISDPKMIYFDVRPSPHLPTLELRVCDACPDVDDVVMLAGLFRALVRRECDALAAGQPAVVPEPPLLRAASWRAARSGLEGQLVDLTGTPRPVPAELAVTGLLERLAPYLEADGDEALVSSLVERALARGSSAAQQRRAYERRGRLTDVVDLLLEQTRGEASPEAERPAHGGGALHAAYAAAGDEVFEPSGTVRAPYRAVVDALTALGPAGMRQREAARDEEQRTHGVTFTLSGEAGTRLFPVDLVPRVVPADDWAMLQRGLTQRARALDAFLHDVYAGREIVRDGTVPAWVVDSAPGLRPTGALAHHQRVRAHVCGMDLVRDERGWYVLEDNLRVPSGLGYAVQNRRLTRAVVPELAVPAEVLDTEPAPRLLLRALQDAVLPGAGDDPGIVLLSEGPAGSAWFEHSLLAREMGVPVVVTTDLVVEEGRVLLQQHGVRTPVDVIYLRVGEETLLHSPGGDGRPLGPPLWAALDAGAVALCNAPGNGVGDDKAVYKYVPEMVRYYLGEQPVLQSVPTFLCGVEADRAEVLARLPELVLKPVDGYGGEGVLIGPTASGEEIDTARRQMLAAPHRWIAQETVQLSTHPAFDGERLDPRHVDLRAFVLLGEESVVAPAALSRVAPAGSMVVNSSRGGGSKDTWVVGAAGAAGASSA
ncbi:glutamate--cysteine ligase [Motilibacter peucedani]